MSKKLTKNLAGRSLRVGDTIEVWWEPNRDTIIALEKYDGPIKHVFPAGARIASFSISRAGMTIPNDQRYEVVSRAAVVYRTERKRK